MLFRSFLVLRRVHNRIVQLRSLYTNPAPKILVYLFQNRIRRGGIDIFRVLLRLCRKIQKGLFYDFFQLLKVILLSVSLRYDPINHICGDEEQDTEHKEQYRTQFVFSFHGASLSQEKRRDRCLSYPVSPPASLSLTVFAFIFTFAPQQCNNCTHAGNS